MPRRGLLVGVGDAAEHLFAGRPAVSWLQYGRPSAEKPPGWRPAGRDA
jgi:hypothetical protein